MTTNETVSFFALGFRPNQLTIMRRRNKSPLKVSCDDDNENYRLAKENVLASECYHPQSPPSPTSPFSPSPRRLRLGGAPGGTSAREALVDHCGRNSFTTPIKKEQHILVEFLVCGNLRTADASWLPNASAWFPAELHQVHRERTTKKIWAQVLTVVLP